MGYHTVNFSDVDSFEPLPKDEYAVEIEKVEVREAKDGESLYLNFELVVIDGDYENRRLWTIRSLKDSAAFYLQQAMIDLGVIDDQDEEINFEWDDDIEPSAKSGPLLLEPNFEGLEAIATVIQEPYDGKIQNRVINLIAEGKPKKTKKRSSRTSEPARSARRSKDDDYEDEPHSRSRRNESADSQPRSQSRRRRVR